jgi:hypothetical protein
MKIWAKIKKAPRAICTGTILPCRASIACRHYGIHNCPTFDKHVNTPCPHYPEHDFKCMKLEEECNEKAA